MEKNWEDMLRLLEGKGGRYASAGYLFLFEALDHTRKTLQREGHVTGRELLAGIRSLALREFGMLARTVFSSWGITRCEDFGEMVFHLVASGLMGKTEEDCREDFSGGYDFTLVFEDEPARALRTEILQALKKKPASG